MTYIIIFLTIIVSIAALRNRTLFDRLSLVPYRVVHDRQWWRVITHGFVHGDYVHLAVNMFVLLSFGQFIERFFGAYQQIGLVSNGDLWYLLLYFGGMVAASVYDLIRYRNNPRYASIGASGAVSAVVFASIFFNPWSKNLPVGRHSDSRHHFRTALHRLLVLHGTAPGRPDQPLRTPVPVRCSASSSRC